MIRTPQFASRDGYVIVVVLIVVVILSLAAYTFTDLMASEYRAAVRTRDGAQSRAYAVSGIHYTAATLADPATLTSQLGGNPTLGGAFHDTSNGITVFENAADPLRSGRFALVAVTPDGNGGFTQTFGAVIDEGGKLNINALIVLDSKGTLLHDALMKFPNMTEEIADAIVDWVDSDDTPRANGAETSHYGSLAQGYKAKNGPLNSLDELLLVRGVTPDLLFGNDRNRNGVADDYEGQQFSRGWADYLTVYGRELNLDTSGAIREYINDTELENLPGLHQRLVSKIGQEPADFLLAYRLFSSTVIQPVNINLRFSPTTDGGGQQTQTQTQTQPKQQPRFTVVKKDQSGGSQQPTTRPATAAELSEAVKTALSAETIQMRGKRPGSYMDLRYASITLPKPQGAQPNDPTPVYASSWSDPARFNEVLPLLMNYTTTTTRVELTPRLNVNTAPREVLLTIPGLADADVTNIVSKRSSQQAGTPATVTGAWLVTSGAITPETFKNVEKYVTGQSMIYRVHAIGYTRPDGPVARVEAVIDTNRGAPRILYYRDLSELGGITPPGGA